MLTQLAFVSLGLACCENYVQANLDTHNKGFMTRDLKLLTSTYSENAIIRAHNQYNGDKVTLKGHAGVAQFFNYLWGNMGTLEDFHTYFSAPEVVIEENCDLCNEEQQDATGPGCISGNVFIVWKNPKFGFKSGADTLIMDSSGLTRLQNAVFWYEPTEASPFSSGITSGTCASHGLVAITSHDECVKAAGPGLPVSDVSETATPAGCWGVEGKKEVCFNTLTTATLPPCSEKFPCYCKKPEPSEPNTPTGPVLCPGQPAANYCDCQGDCTANADWCSCEEAKKCCEGAKPTVTCPGQPAGNYCDCEGDCTENADWCSCEEAQKCCSGYNHLEAPAWASFLKFTM